MISDLGLFDVFFGEFEGVIYNLVIGVYFGGCASWKLSVAPSL